MVAQALWLAPPDPAAATGPTAAPTPEATTTTEGTHACVDDPNVGGEITRLTPDQTLLRGHVTITFERSGWTGCGLFFKGQRNGLPAMMVGFWPITFVYPDPCRWRNADRSHPLGPDVSDVEDALAVQAESELIDATPAVQTRVGGRPASHLTLSVPEDVDLSDCDGSGETEFRFWDGPGENGEGAVWWIPARAAPGLIGEIYIVDVDGQRVGIQTVHFSDAPAGTGEELQQIVDSIVFEPQGL